MQPDTWAGRGRALPPDAYQLASSAGQNNYTLEGGSGTTAEKPPSVYQPIHQPQGWLDRPGGQGICK